MPSKNEAVSMYSEALKTGLIQDGYRIILACMSQLQRYLAAQHPEMHCSYIYPGTMDMTYFALIPDDLASQNLKIALVYLHREQCFEVWLAGKNRKAQQDLYPLLKDQDLGASHLSVPGPGVDSILTRTLLVCPDFDHAETLNHLLEEGIHRFLEDVRQLLPCSLV